MAIKVQYKEFMHHQFIITICLGVLLGGILSDTVNESPLYGAFIGMAISAVLAFVINNIPVKSDSSQNYLHA